MKNKKCSRCKQIKPENLFAVRNYKNGNQRLQAYCRECNNRYHKAHYEANKANYIKNNLARSRGYVETFYEFLSTKLCADCGNSDIRVLEFDHREPTEKSNEISRLVRYSKWETLLKEIEKCDIVCANCHKIRTLTRMDSRKLRYHVAPVV